VATLLDEGEYVCSVSTLYRLLHKNKAVGERRRLLRHPRYKRPQLLATGPNQLWSWDITKLKGPGKYTYYYLYVLLDVYSRYVVGWCIAYRESTQIAEQLILEACLQQGVVRGQLTVHADRGSAMISKGVAQLLSDLGVEKTHSRPHVSNDNPYSEAQFKTLKYRPDFPELFGSLQDARRFCAEFFAWYNNQHRHSGIAMLTPATVHYGKAEEVIAKRQSVLEAAYAQNPERFVRHAPRHAPLPEAVWINPPEPDRAEVAPGATLLQ
jgi:putative transposase